MKKEVDSEPETLSIFFLTGTVVSVQILSDDDDAVLPLESSEFVAKIKKGKNFEIRSEYNVSVHHVRWPYDRPINGYFYLGPSCIIIRHGSTLYGVTWALARRTLLLFVTESSIIV